MKPSIAEAGAIVFRFHENEPQVLLVRSRKDPSCWIFPKGHVEPGESEDITSGRELLEEAGVEGHLICKVGSIEFGYKARNYIVVYFLHKFVRTVSAGEQGRTPMWCSIDEAFTLLSYDSIRDLLGPVKNIIRNLPSV